MIVNVWVYVYVWVLSHVFLCIASPNLRVFSFHSAEKDLLAPSVWTSQRQRDFLHNRSNWRRKRASCFEHRVRLCFLKCVHGGQPQPPGPERDGQGNRISGETPGRKDNTLLSGTETDFKRIHTHEDRRMMTATMMMMDNSFYWILRVPVYSTTVQTRKNNNGNIQRAL